VPADHQPIARKPVSEAVAEALRADILTGRVTAGEALPSERILSEQFAVNRHAVREALKRLQEAGLVVVTLGGPTRVLDWRRTGGHDLLADLPVGAGDAPAAAVIRSIVEMRLAVGADVARRCAERASAGLGRELRRLAATETTAVDDAALAVRYAELWERIVDGADNVAYRLAFNSLLAGLDVLGDLSLQLFAPEFRDLEAQAALVAAVASHDPEAAEAAARDLLARALGAALNLNRGATRV
jgi:GntR family transcriptional regulator, transcriptional repressor for pyruvate dehydrogenase complex